MVSMLNVIHDEGQRVILSLPVLALSYHFLSKKIRSCHMSDLSQLASLLKSRNVIDGKIATIIDRPTHLQDVGAYIASVIFGIALVPPGTDTDIDGKFITGPFAGRTVAVQWHPRHESSLPLKTDTPIDYYLIFVGPKSSAPSIYSPWLIEAVYLFDAHHLLMALRERGVQIGTRTSVITELWDRAEIYPQQHNTALLLSQEQRSQLALFR
jgi:hypothetical protein